MELNIRIILLLILSATQMPVRYDILKSNYACNNSLEIGICQNNYAYTIANGISITKCIQSSKYLQLSPQTIIDNSKECYSFTNVDDFINALNFVKTNGIPLLSELPDDSFYSGSTSNSDLSKKYDNKITDYQEETDSIKIKKALINGDLVLLLTNFDIDIKANIGEIIDVFKEDAFFKNELSIFTITGWDQIDDKHVWNIKGNYGNKWGDNGFAKISIDSKYIKNIYVIKLN